MKTLFWIVLAKTICVLLFILYGNIRLGPDEAQYWTWSQKLAPGYYSKPGGIAFQIALGTSLFGNTELGVRFGSLLFGFFTPFLIYGLAKTSSFNDRDALWAGIVWTLSPLGVAGSFLAITDVGMIFFWTLACLILLSKGPGPLLGLTVALGACFKWPIYFFWLFATVYLWRRWDRYYLIAIALSLLGLLPALLWNLGHDWATFRHVGATLQGGSGAIKALPNPLEFFATQVALLSPIFFILMLLSYRKPTFSLSAIITLPALLMGTFLSLFMKVQGNWAIFAYPTAPLLTVLGAQVHSLWLKLGTALSVAMMLGALPFLGLLKHNTAWNDLPHILQEAGYDPSSHFLASDKYQNTAILSFYSPRQNRAYFLNLKGDRLNQYSFWPGLKEERLHRNGFFVTFDPNPPPLAPYFSRVTPLAPQPFGGNKTAYLYKVEDYNGQEPPFSSKY